jgi:hypothetical protein
MVKPVRRTAKIYLFLPHSAYVRTTKILFCFLNQQEYSPIKDAEILNLRHSRFREDSGK